MHFAAGAEWYCHPADYMVSHLYYLLNLSSKIMLMLCELNGYSISNYKVMQLTLYAYAQVLAAVVEPVKHNMKLTLKPSCQT